MSAHEKKESRSQSDSWVVRVLIVGPQPPPNGGIATVVRNTLAHPFGESIDLRLFDYTAVPRPANTFFRIAQAVTFRMGPFGLWGLHTLWLLRAFRLALLEYQPSIVHLHASHGYGFWSSCLMSRIAQRGGSKTILHCHGSDMDIFYEKLWWWNRILFRRFIRGVDHCVALSESWRRWYGHFLPEDRLSVVPNAIEWARFQGRRTNDGNASPIVLFVGMIEARRKGVHDLIACLRDVQARIPDIRVRLAGVDNERVEENLHVDASTRSALQFLGDLDPEALINEYARATLFVLPAYREGMPMVMLEAMASGLAVICSRINAIPEVIEDGVNGILIEPGDRKSLTSAIRRLLTDKNLRKRLGENASRTIRERHDLRVQGRRLEELYLKLTATGEGVDNAR